MAKRMIGIILVAAALLTAVLGVKAGTGAGGNKNILKDAVYLEDGKISSENEGKTVIVTGTLEAEVPFTDKRTGIELDSVVAYRTVEQAHITHGTDDEEDVWTWVMVLDEKFLGGSGKVFAPNPTLGEFAVSEELMQAVGPDQPLEDYDSEACAKEGWDIFREEGLVWLYHGDWMPIDEEVVEYGGFLGKPNYDYRDYEDTLRVHYRVLSADKDLTYTAIGVQRDGKLEKLEDLKMTAMIPGSLNVEELMEYADSSATSAAIAAFVIAVVLAGLGVLLIIKSGKPAKAKKQ